MATKTKQWPDGSSATIQYGGQGDGEIIITSDPNEHYEARSMQIVVETTDGSGIQRAVTINQAAKQRIDLSAAVVTAATQTYSGSAKTPTPTVTLNGSIVPSSGYDVAYSNNTNAGTATITITGKGDYTGTATGTFTINKAAPSYTAPTTRSLTYSGSSQYLTTSGSTSHGIIYYSSDGVNWYTSRRTATTAGSYNCYWKLVGDSNHTDISSTYLGTTTIDKASRTISFTSKPTTLNEGDSSTLAASVSAGSGDGTISFSSSNSSVASINGSTVTGVSGGSCTITASISAGTNYKSASTSYTLSVVELDYVDLGLPSGTLWAKCNIDISRPSGFAASPFQYGATFFSWGNTDGHNPTNTTSFGSYTFGTSNSTEPYASSSGAALTGEIPTSNDAAKQTIGSSWKMPTETQFSELIAYVKFINADGTEIPSSTANKIVQVNGVYGLYLKSKINNNRIFFACCGYGNDSSLSDRGTAGMYWSSSLYNTANARSLGFYGTTVGPRLANARYLGFTIRPVRS